MLMPQLTACIKMLMWQLMTFDKCSKMLMRHLIACSKMMIRQPTACIKMLMGKPMTCKCWCDNLFITCTCSKMLMWQIITFIKIHLRFLMNNYLGSPFDRRNGDRLRPLLPGSWSRLFPSDFWHLFSQPPILLHPVQFISSIGIIGNPLIRSLDLKANSDHIMVYDLRLTTFNHYSYICRGIYRVPYRIYIFCCCMIQNT